MDKQRCVKCSAEENIPTHQYVKFDNRRYDLCGSCWFTFRHAFYGWIDREKKPNLGRVYESGVVTGVEPHERIYVGTDPTKAVLLRLEVHKELKKWFHDSEKKGLERKTE